MRDGSVRFIRVAIGTAALVGLPAMQAPAADLTGTWEGTVNCQQFIQGQSKDTVVVKKVQVQISQSGGDLNFQIDNPSTGVPIYFDGIMVDDGVHPLKGEAGLLECTSGVEAIGGAMIRARASTDPKTGKGKFTATLFAADSDPVQQVVTCKLNFKRVSTTDPGVPGCP
jgi:hypothetical protein